MTKQWKKMASIGAVFGTNLYKTGTTVFTAAELKNEEIALGISGTGLTLTNAGSGVTLAKANVGLSGVHDDANKFEVVADSTEGRASFRTNAGSTTTYDVFSSGARTQVDYLRGGTLPGGSGTLESTTGSQTKATAAQSAAASDATTKSDAAEAAAKAVEVANRITFPTDNTEGQFSFSTGGGTAVVNNVFSSGERTKLNNLRNGKTPTNASLSIINSETTASNVGLGSVTDGADVTGDNTAADTAAVNGTSASTVKAGAALGASSNQDSTATIRNGVTTYVVNKGTSIVWSNLAGNMTPNDTTYDWTITWRNGSGTSLGTTVIRASLNGTTALAIMSTQSNGASATVNLGGAVSSGSLQTTTVTLNSIIVTLTAKIIDGSGWDFK